MTGSTTSGLRVPAGLKMFSRASLVQPELTGSRDLLPLAAMPLIFPAAGSFFHSQRRPGAKLPRRWRAGFSPVKKEDPRFAGFCCVLGTLIGFTERKIEVIA